MSGSDYIIPKDRLRNYFDHDLRLVANVVNIMTKGTTVGAFYNCQMNPSSLPEKMIRNIYLATRLHVCVL